MGDRDIVERFADWRQRSVDPAGQAHLIFTELFPERAAADAEMADQRRRDGRSRGPLDGAFVSVKDLFDVQSTVTTAGSVILGSNKPAEHDAPAVARLREAGAIIVGKTAMTEFAYSGVGINPHFGTPKNPFDRATGRLPGGSSSGAAVSIADGLADVALASDTGGSVRIPAALCGLVGWKPTASRVPRGGMVPLSTTLDTVGVIARTLDRCVETDAAISDLPCAPTAQPSRRIGVLRGTVLADLDDEVSGAYATALATLSGAGFELVELELPELEDAIGRGLGPRIVAYEAFAYHRERLAAAGHMYDPRVRHRIETGRHISAEDYEAARAARNDTIRAVAGRLADIGCWLMPTTPIVAPPIAACDSDDAFFRINGLLLRNPATVNFLDGCAVTLPCGRGDNRLPVGITIAGLGGCDAEVLGTAAMAEPLLRAVPSE